MPSEEKNYEQSALGKRVNELMDDGYDFGEAVKQAMSEGLKDGGSVGIEILFGPKVPAAPSQLVSESDILLGYRGDAAYRSGSEQSKSIGQGNVGSKASFGGGQGRDRSGRSEGAGGVNPNQYTSKQQNVNQIKANLGIKDPNLLQKTFNKYNSLPFGVKGAINTMAPVELMKLFQVGNVLNTGYNQLKKPILTEEDITLEPGKLPELTLGMNDIPKFNFEEMTGITSQDPANMQLAKVFNTKEDLIGLGAAKDSFFDTLTPKGEALEKFRKNATSMNNPTGTFQEYKGLGAESQLDTLIGKGNKNATENEAVIRDALEKGFLENESDFINQKPLKKAFADGGRVGLFMGGSPLTGEALSIYNSMKAYGNDDQAIADRLQALGMYTPGDSTPDTPDTTPGQTIGYQGGNDSPYAGQVVDQTDYSFNKKNYAPGEKLEINPAAFGVSFPDQPSAPKREGIINQAIDSFTSLPTRSLSSFASPTTGGNIVGPAEQGFMGQTLDIDPAGRTREEIRSLYDNYNRFTGRTSNFADARQKGKAGQVLGSLVGAAAGIPFVGKGIDMLSNAFGPQGDKSLQSKYTVDGAGFGNTGARDEFGLATFDKKDGFLGLTGNTTRNYTDRMNERLGELTDFFSSRIDDFDINNLNPATLSAMSKINGFYTKQVQAYKDRLEVERINREQKERERMEASAANRADANAITNRLANEYKAQQQRDGRDFSVSGPDTSANPTGKSNQASSERGYALHGAKGGSVPTGLATMFTRRR